MEQRVTPETIYCRTLNKSAIGNEQKLFVNGTGVLDVLL